MKPLDTLPNADRHCDMEGLPPPSKEARALDDELRAGKLTPADAIRRLVKHHGTDQAGAGRRSRVA